MSDDGHDNGHSPWLQLVAMRQERDAARAEVAQLKAEKTLLRPRLAARPPTDGQCWAIMTVYVTAPRMPCERWARPGHRTCGIHHDWEAAAQAAEADETPCP